LRSFHFSVEARGIVVEIYAREFERLFFRECAASQKVSSAPTASLNGKASEPNMMRSG